MRLGTIVVVVIKARHLPNKQTIGKQDAYCTLTFGGRTARTPVMKRAGQTPEWDHEERFEVFTQGEATDVRSEVTATGGVKPTSASPSPRPSKPTGKRELKVAVYADDPRDPELIGSTMVDLEETIKKGEVDGQSSCPRSYARRLLRAEGREESFRRRGLPRDDVLV